MPLSPAGFQHRTRQLALYLSLGFVTVPLLSSLLFAQGIQTAGHETLVNLPDAVVQQPYSHQLEEPPAGAPPWAWHLASGTLPPGLTVNPDGTITGTPTAVGSFRWQMQATDSATTPAAVSYQVELAVRPQLEMQWDAQPSLDSDTIQGRVRVINHSQESLNLTVIVVAINEIGKAFALGYQHFDFAPGSQVIDFGSSLPRGSYLVHADAIGVSATSAASLYSGLQTPQPLVVP